MSTATVNYFHSASLRQRFLHDLHDAVRDAHLSVEEQVWLQCAAHAPDEEAPDPLRVDRLVFSDGSPRPFELAGALMLSHGLTDNPRVYLHTLAKGIEAFDNRSGLLATLRTRFAEGNAEVLFEYEKIEGDAFKAQMLGIVEQQAEQVGQLTTQLALTPSLLDATTASLTRQLSRLLPHMPLDPTTHLLQIAPKDDGDPQPDLVVQTLTQAALDDSCKVNLDVGYERRFLDTQGLLATTGDSALFIQAFTAAQAGLGECHRELLAAFWRGTGAGHNGTRRTQAIEAFKSSLRRELYDANHSGTLHADTQQALLPLLQPVTETALSGGDLRCHRLSLKVGDGPECPLAATFLVKPASEAAEQVLWFSSDHRFVHFADLASLTAFLATPSGREQLRPALALVDQPMLERKGALQIALQEIQTPLCADRVDSVIAMQERNRVYAAGVSCASEKRSAMIDDALDVRLLLDPRQLAFGCGRWNEGASVDFARTWLKVEPAVPVTVSAVEPAAVQATQPSEQATVQGAVDNTTEPEPEAQEVSTAEPTPVKADDSSDTSTPTRSLTASWTQFVQSFDSRAQQLQTLDNVLIHRATQALQRYLCVLLTHPVALSSVHVQWLESGPVDTSEIEEHAVSVSESLQVVSMDVVSLLIECVTGHRSPQLAATAQLKLDPAMASGHLEVELIRHMLTQAARGFDQGYIEDFRQSRLGTQRLGDQHSRPYQEALSIREDAIRLDLSLAKRQGRIDSTAMTMARQVLDRPVRGLRLALGTPVIEAYSVSLAGGEQTPATLCDTLVIRQPLDPDSPSLLWTCEFGWRQFASVERLKATVQFNLRNENRERWLALLGEADRRALRAHLLKPSENEVLIELARVDGHVMQTQQASVLSRQQQDLQQLCKRALRCRFEASLFTRLARLTEQDWQLGVMLDGLWVRIDNSIFEAMLPAWVKKASVAELMQYYKIFQRYYQASDNGRDFLFGIPTLENLARQKLTEALKRDFPTEAFDPDAISVTSRQYVVAFPVEGELPSAIPAATEVRTESLVYYAINRFIDAQDAALSVTSVAHPHAHQLLTPDYLRALIREVDVGAAYVALLRKAFTPTEAHYADRKRLFVEQLPAVLMAIALPEKVEGRLSETAYDYIARVLDMPDGIAREPIDNTWVVLSPLQLVADEGMTPDPVTGLYLICPAAADAGPVVLYAVYHDGFVFREYASRQALQEAIRTDVALQALLLERLDPEVHRRYAHGGFVEPHLPFSVEGLNTLPVRAPGPVTVAIDEIKGNALQTFFNGTLELLLDMGVSNAVSNDQADQAGRRFLATLALGQTLSLLPGKLGALVSLWQSHTLLRASAVSAADHSWAQALSEFTAALGVMVTTREQSLGESPPKEGGEQGEAAAVGEQVHEAGSSFSWGRTTLTAEQRIRLQGLEAQNVALSEMRHDELLNLYFDQEDETPYAVVAGRVYQVKRLAEAGEWMITGSTGAPGPHIVLDSDQRWRLDLDLRLRGGGGAVTRVLNTVATTSAEAGLVTEARGMAEIRQLYRYRARCIAEAHQQAQHYLENCLDNLNARQPDGSLDPRVERIIGDYFGTAHPDQALLTAVQRAVRTLLDAVMDPSLSPFTSERFVIGTNRPGRGNVTAFVIPLDPQRRVFLTNRFFRPPRFRLTPAAMQEGFATTQHFQAATLIHELSHQVLDTKDIAYLESNAPYPDLLREDTATNVRTHAQILRMQDYRFSHRTPKNDLFTQMDEHGNWRDVERDDAQGYNTVLRITGAKTLDEARTIFLADVDKRSQIMLKNADSVGLLILRLGRRNFTALTP